MTNEKRIEAWLNKKVNDPTIKSEYENSKYSINPRKPKYDFIVNTGMYLLNPCVLKYIPDGICFDMNELIDVLQKKTIRVGVYPVSEKSWVDIGQLTEYKKVLKELAD